MNADQLSQQAMRCLQNNDPNGALKYLSQALEMKPNDISILQNMGIIYWQADMLDEAIPYFNKVIEINPPKATAAFMMRGKIQALKGNSQQAINDLNAAFKDKKVMRELPPEELYVLYRHYGICSFELENYKAAFSALSKALDISEEKDPSLLYYRGEASFRMSKFDDCIKDLGAFLPHATYVDFGVTQNDEMVQQKSPFAKLAYQTFVLLGAANAETNRFEPSISAFEHAENCNHDFPVFLHLYRAKAYMKMGKFHEAAEDYKKAISLDPDNQEFRVGLSDALKKINQKSEQPKAKGGGIFAKLGLDFSKKKNTQDKPQDKVNLLHQLRTSQASFEEICKKMGCPSRLYNHLVLCLCADEEAIKRLSTDEKHLAQMEALWQKGLQAVKQNVRMDKPAEVNLAVFMKLLGEFKDKKNALEKKGGPQADGDLYEEIMFLSEDISNHLGLVPTQEFEEILYSYSDGKIGVEQVMNYAMEEQSKIVPDSKLLETLKSMRRSGVDHYDICMKLGFTPHIYNFIVLSCCSDEEAGQRLMTRNDFMGEFAMAWEKGMRG